MHRRPANVKVSKIGQARHFPRKGGDVSRSPGRELLWMWTHPVLFALLLLDIVLVGGLLAVR